ncbi:deazaflavin-dependent oxidoreductase (nitroreductase family) [Knoellia remsis]|uniref:Deazaflavin-dependent oxidoreductase (Nitroreductase family) n=1 Tax=Knoellia remsis TaxID=407159 RepID=A0A2T0V0J9_9MICO|nr:nitroreductase family deazaflavin-dependent oxidoreductase [Knoellia remsis]PRY63692.1 deazaflavin-dependent oxidoreductase (nitroreductase family) [Knoellia remsis]
MAITGTYVPSPSDWVRKQVEKIEETGTTDSVDIQGRPVVLLTMNGVTGSVRKVPLMRVEHDGVYAAVASKGGAPDNPKWYANLLKNPVIELQDGTRSWTARARELEGAEREQWWPRCVEAFPPYAEYQQNTDRLIPVFVLEPVDEG